VFVSVQVVEADDEQSKYTKAVLISGQPTTTTVPLIATRAVVVVPDGLDSFTLLLLTLQDDDDVHW